MNPALWIARHLLVLPFVFSAVTAARAQETFGRFSGDVIAKFLPDGRNMQLEKPFGYTDPRGRTWAVPVGATTDGASLPRILWVSHPPFTGKYRQASVIHDYFCQVKSRPWRETHEAFYLAMRASGVDEPTAKTMYGAVYYFGPRWGIGAGSRGPGGLQTLTPEQEARFYKDLSIWVQRERPTLEEIARRVENAKPFLNR